MSDDRNLEVLTPPEPLVLTTDQDGLTLREMTTVDEDQALLQAQNDNLNHIAQFGNTILKTVEEATEARLNSGWVKLGIWKDGQLIGLQGFKPNDTASEAETGIWLIHEATGHGYATSACTALSRYLAKKYHRVFLETAANNQKAIKTFERSGYRPTGQTIQRDYGQAIVMDFVV
jgi:ribosomal-protein-serine acetyltransferase